MKRREYRRKYFRKNRIAIYKKLLDVYAFTAIRKVREQESSCVEKLFLKYPYEEYCEKYFKRLCAINRIYQGKYAYQECYDACQLAYMYSIHRCSVSCNNTIDGYVGAYIKKIMKIYFIAAIVICDETGNICKENGFSHITMDDYRV